jgi:hypothetical protein
MSKCAFVAWRRLPLLAIAVLVTGLLTAGSAVAASPYPASTILGNGSNTGVTWNESNRARYASDSDIWDSMWVDDGAPGGNVYGAWGDGHGFAGSPKRFIGLSKLAGSPLTLTGSDPYLGTPFSNPPPCAQQTTLGGKPRGVVAFTGSLMYMFHSTQDLCTSFSWLAKSTNNGMTWTDHVNSLQWPDAGGFGPGSILQSGMAQSSALVPDSGTTPYIWIYGGKSSDPAGSGKQYLARVPASPTNAIENLSNWRWYGGLNAAKEPMWQSSSSSATPVFTDPDHAQTLEVTYDPGIGRYLAYNDHGNACLDDGTPAPCLHALALFDAPTPWGPWTTFDYVDNFENVSGSPPNGCGTNCSGTSPAISFAIQPKWTSADGLTIWPEYSGTGAWDSLNVVQGTIGLASGSVIKGLSLSTGKPAILDHLSTTYPGSKQYIDRQYQYTALPSGYSSGLESIRLPNNDKANNSSTYLTFTLTAQKTVCVGWDTLNPVPSWLTGTGWSDTGQNLTGNDGTATFHVYKKTYPAGLVQLPGPNTHDVYLPFVGCP